MFTTVQSKFSSFFFGCFYFRKWKSADIYEKYLFVVFFGATDGIFTEKYSVTPSWQRTCLWQMTGVRIVLCRSLDFDMFQMTYKYNSVSSEDFGSLKFPWKKVQHSESGWYAHDLRYMFVVTSSCPPWRLINFFQKMTTRGEISLRDIAHKITFFHSLICFICLKRLLLRTLDVNIAKLCNIWFGPFFAHCPYPPWVPNCMQNLKGGWKFSFPKMFDSYRELFLMLSVKADANRKHTKLENKAFILFVLLLSYLVNFTARFFLISKNNSHLHVKWI